MMFKELHPSLRNAMYVVLISFTALVAATFYTIRLTYKNFEPVMDKNYYEIGLNYEKAIENQKELLKEGYLIKTNWDNQILLPMGESEISVQLEKNGTQTNSSAKTMTVFLERNATTKNTARYDLKPTPNGFVGKIPLLEKGTWNLRLVADIDGKSFEREGKISIK
ncbi:FixH family protein [Leptospira soteropolitanensis]|uniref:FixH family protein n=2 Tax=Leptospira soteropolitanensis TaxID=2950025 RepID=A0AAW5VJV4_9LEPT|nr:FixH family protein [Leptospira soteropolitanensis]MCW7500445.1 FixH family protein [Leptospira soteropolitanensis]MCW7522520.1 FixH family protein [Leptospira soteropolitanensis]MCW7530415.1 FixH family protein [Leptospira soteropolitanensis]